MTLRPFAGNTDIEAIIDNWNVDHAFKAAISIVSNIGGCHRFKLIGWFCGDEINDTGRRVAAIKRALRPA